VIIYPSNSFCQPMDPRSLLLCPALPRADLFLDLTTSVNRPLAAPRSFTYFMLTEAY
jgi:hypothetical protein